MRQFFDPSLLPVTTTDLEGNVLYVRTYGLNHYGYADIIAEQGGEEAEQLLLDILDRIFSLEFDMNATWNYNGKILRLEIGDDGLAHVVYPEIDEARIITIISHMTGKPGKYLTKGLTDLYGHPEAEVTGDTKYGKEILGFLMDEVKEGVVYDEDTMITFENLTYLMKYTYDRKGNQVVQIQLQEVEQEISNKSQTIKRNRPSHLKRIK